MVVVRILDDMALSGTFIACCPMCSSSFSSVMRAARVLSSSAPTTGRQQQQVYDGKPEQCRQQVEPFDLPLSNKILSRLTGATGFRCRIMIYHTLAVASEHLFVVVLRTFQIRSEMQTLTSPKCVRRVSCQWWQDTRRQEGGDTWLIKWNSRLCSLVRPLALHAHSSSRCSWKVGVIWPALDEAGALVTRGSDPNAAMLERSNVRFGS
jgi:hypothetical protein